MATSTVPPADKVGKLSPDHVYRLAELGDEDVARLTRLATLLSTAPAAAHEQANIMLRAVPIVTDPAELRARTDAVIRYLEGGNQ